MGDVLAVAASLIGICIATWALLMASALLFPDRLGLASDAIKRSPVKTGLTGLLLTGVLGFIGIVLLAQPLPAAKLAGWMLVLALLTIAALGMAGLAQVVADRIERMEPALSRYACLVRAAAILVIPGILPILGWFLVGPLLLLIGVGAGAAAMRGRARTAVEPQVA